MPQDDYERYRKRLEEQLHADIGLLYDAFHAKLRAYQTMVRSRSGELDLELSPQPSSGGSPVPAPAPTTTAPAPPGPPPPENWSQPMVDVLREVLPRLPEEFDKSDVLQALGFEPRRSTFYEALQLLRAEGVINIARGAGGKRAALYRKVAGGS
jgi:hypothetical protein